MLFKTEHSFLKALRQTRSFAGGPIPQAGRSCRKLGTNPAICILQSKMGWLTGFEPATLGTTSRCSNQLSYSHHLEKYAYRTPLMKSRYGLPVCTLVNSALKEIYLF